MAQAEGEQRKVRLELLDGTIEVVGSEEFVRKAQALFMKLTTDFKEAHVQPAPIPPLHTPLAGVTPQSPVTDIRTLREQKQPRTQIEMAALVAYYVTELAPEPDRKESIGASDVKRYFGNALFRTTTPPNVILGNAKTAGYLDSVSSGQYRLNPIGYNLVTAGLPPSAETATRGRRKTKKASARKNAAKKKSR